jgi:predicted glycogen debranching enzyme
MRCFGPETCTDLEAATGLEWLETNGLGGYASGTVAGPHTRRYHGLLVAALRPPVDRYLLLSRLEETLVVDGVRFELGANYYSGVVYPQGHRHLAEFRLTPFPVWTYRPIGAPGIELARRVLMLHGENTLQVEYELRGGAGRSVTLEVRPLIAFRDHHSSTHENPALNPHVDFGSGLASMQPYPELPRLYLGHDAEAAEPTGEWYRRFQWPVEQDRGLEAEEDLFQPFLLRFDLLSRPSAVVIASTQPHETARAAENRRQELERRQAVTASVRSRNPFAAELALAADAFIVARGEQKSIIAGYPWFSDWGRDTMIALPGLTLATGRHEIARDILLAFAEHVDQGMLPNRFPDAAETPEYNTVDATLWFFEAVRALLAATGDEAFVRERLYPLLGEIVAWHVRGTRYGIRVDKDGLLRAGEPGVQLTWMDAKVDDWVVTPRIGKPVEIQALWYNSLRTMEDLARRFDEPDAARVYRQQAVLARRSFAAQFWNEAAGCLYDVVDGDFRDPAVRPNQLFAVSLSHALVSGARAKSIVEVAGRELLTPYGLRSLSPADPAYRGRYEGGILSRDGAYHQGTVWAWLMGPFLTAYLKVNRRSAKAKQQAREWLASLRLHLADAGLGQISEVFDGDPPHRPGGCIAQAWSVSELLRVIVEEDL